MKHKVTVHMETQPRGVDVEVLGLGVVENGGSFEVELDEDQVAGLEENPWVTVASGSKSTAKEKGGGD